MSDDEYLKTFVDFLGAQPGVPDLTYEDVARAKTRDELGISSLAIILVLVNYLKERTDDTIALQPEWVSRLHDVDGIVSVIRLIEEARPSEASA